MTDFHRQHRGTLRFGRWQRTRIGLCRGTAALFFASVGACVAAASGEGHLTYRSIRPMTTPALAERLLGAGRPSQVTTHELVEMSLIPGTLTGVRFFEEPQPVATRLCRREATFVSLVPVPSVAPGAAGADMPVRPGRADALVELALAPGCRLSEGARFATVLPSAAASDAGRVLAALGELRDRARRSGLTQAEAACVSKVPASPCSNGANAVLASMPIERASSIARIGGEDSNSWSVIIRPGGEGQAYWDIRVSDASTAPTAQLMWLLPPSPF